jgi:hypothetical protein
LVDLGLDLGLDFGLEVPPLLMPLPELPPLLIPLPELLLLLIPLPDLPLLLIPLPTRFPVDFGEVAVVGESVGDCVGLVVPAAVNPLVTLVAVVSPDVSTTDGGLVDSAVAIVATCSKATAWVKTTVTMIDPSDRMTLSSELVFNPAESSAASAVSLLRVALLLGDVVSKSPSYTTSTLGSDVVGDSVGENVGDVIGEPVGDAVLADDVGDDVVGVGAGGLQSGS